MPAPRRIAVVAVSLAVALSPVAARAQNGAGDEQYTDPFAGQSQPKPKPKPAQTQQQAQPAQQQTQPAQQQAAPATPAPSTQSTGGARELPRTGFDVIPFALVGLALVAAGLALRRRGAHGRD